MLLNNEFNAVLIIIIREKAFKTCFINRIDGFERLIFSKEKTLPKYRFLYWISI